MAGDHVDEARRKRADSVLAAARRIEHLAPAVEHVGAAEFLLHLERHAASVEDATETGERSLEHLARQRAGARAVLQRLGQQAVGVAREPVAERRHHVDDLGQRRIERGPRLAPRPHQFVQVQRRRGEAAVALLGAGDRHALHDMADRDGCGDIHALICPRM
jgi:hypothetical protein